MTIAAERISEVALYDLLHLFDVQPWMKQQAGQLTELWNFCHSREEQMLLKALLEKFCLLDADRQQNACKDVANKIQEWDLDPKLTWIVATANKEEIDGSTAGLQILKNKIPPIEDWHSRFLPNIPAAGEKIKDGDFIVLFDDFIGTGEKMIKKQKWLSRILSESDVSKVEYYFCSFSAMEFGLNNLAKSHPERVYSSISLKKAISEAFEPDEAAKNLQIMKQIESRLNPNYKNKKLANFSLGYKGSEALYCGQNDNCPNNVFPILWWPPLKDGRKLNTLLTRAG